MSQSRRANRGPSAAEENRAALLRAAREVFADVGIDAPLSAVARRAGVGQGSLYRHFPDRVSLAVAVFEDNLVEVERLAAEPDATLESVLGLLTERAIDSAAFVAMVSTSAPDPRLTAMTQRVAAALDAPLARARAQGLVRPDLDAADVLLAVEMVSGVLASAPAADRPRVAATAWQLLRHGMGHDAGDPPTM